MRSAAMLLLTGLLLAQPLAQCEERLVGIANRAAKDYNAYMKRYHVETISADPNEREQSRKREQVWRELEAVRDCGCW